ncbi:MAG TPA: GHMP kinase [Thermoflexia bacterium]|jgi:D-glycero-alpha-D-manno-heptose-7-phosphate kinase|nr:GHMP kinase [Thermoflexia bacterium]
MIISRTPLRISFVGGGSDLPAFYEREPGAVVSTAINKYIYITVNRKFDNKIRASYSRTEIVDSVEELRHELIREALRMTGIDRAIEITSISDIPSRGTGLGSSSTYTVGLLNALYAHRGRMVGAERLAKEACEIEIERCRKPIGKQDQYIAAYGGLKYIRFYPGGEVEVTPILCAPQTRRELQRRLLMLYTGLTRRADDILAEQSRNCVMDETKRNSLRRMVHLAEQMVEALSRNELDGFGEVLHANWLEKQRLASGITNPDIDRWYEAARAHGAIGGKILGAGGGGFLLLYAPPERHEEICRALPELRAIPFRFEPQGSRIIYVEENGYVP